MSLLPEEWKKLIVCIEELDIVDGKEDYKIIGTGFLIDYDGFNLLVTCKHIVSGDLKKLYLSFNTNNQGIQRIPVIQLSNGQIDWFVDERPEIDIAVIPAPIDFEKWNVRKLPLSMCGPYDELSEGDEIYFLGFPLGIKTNTIHPIVRQGMVAFKQDLNTFLIDAQAYPGNSGSPVFLKPGIIDVDKDGNVRMGNLKAPKLVGIISSYLPYEDYCISLQTKRPKIVFEENSGLASVFPFDLIMGIILSAGFQKMLKTLMPEKPESLQAIEPKSTVSDKTDPVDLTSPKTLETQSVSCKIHPE